jgi:cytoskeletal protein CcmA (bactofilin family)
VPPEIFSKKQNAVPPETTPVESKAAAAVERVLGTPVRMNDAKPSIVSEGFSFSGDIVSDGTIHIEGNITGSIVVDVITIGIRGVVDGQITCSRLHVKGAFKGIAETDELQVDSTASLDGTVSYKVLTAQRGANIVGELLVRK